MNDTPTGESPGYRPDFVFGGNRVISEETWSDYEAQGVSNLIEAMPGNDEAALREELSRKGHFYGAGNLLLGDAFDADTGRPLRLKPGIGLYVTAEGREHFHRRFQSSTKSDSSPVMVLPDGTHIVPRPGVRVKARRPDQPTEPDLNASL
jgi:hypothetical protein